MASVSRVAPRRAGGRESWRVRFWHGGNQHAVGRFATEAAAKRFAALVETQGAEAALAAVAPPPADTPAQVNPQATLLDLGWRYHRTEPNASEVTRKGWVTVMNSLPDWLANIPVTQINLSTIRQWDAAMITEGKVATTRKNRIGFVKARLKEAVDLGVIVSNPMDGYKPQRAAHTPLRRDTVNLTVDDANKIVASIADGDAAFITRLQFQTGLRIGEALALRGVNVAADGSTLTVTASLGKNRQLLPPKNRNSARTVPVPVSFRDELRQRRDNAGSDGYLSTMGVKAMDYSMFKRRILGSQKLWEVAHGYRWHSHDARHTWVTTLINNGTPPQVVASLAGHGVYVALATYAGTTGVVRDNAAAVVEAAFNGEG